MSSLTQLGRGIAKWVGLSVSKTVSECTTAQALSETTKSDSRFPSPTRGMPNVVSSNSCRALSREGSGSNSTGVTRSSSSNRFNRNSWGKMLKNKYGITYPLEEM